MRENKLGKGPEKSYPQAKTRGKWSFHDEKLQDKKIPLQEA
jgi:hypothetical protein